ncbi:RHS repeat-associated core domain-containing protein [uncultured Croceitalea sp.]|uniref:RHS repeat domain-containing protein n=1 Tax=uncultured Croceitalea sp. TaxID=1798908 RepID=UPI0033063B4B
MKKIIIFIAVLGFMNMATAQNCPNGCFDEGPNGPECGKLGYYDGDGDGFGSGSLVCYFSGDTGYVRKGGDCNDSSSSVYPRRFYRDNDGDGYGSTASTLICQGSSYPPSGYATNFDDCDDGNANITIARNWYQDADNDSFGDPNTSSYGCTPQGLTNPVTNNNDYNDGNPNITDVSPRTFYFDNDGDTYGVNSNTEFRSYPSSSSYVPQGGDCNDNNTNINPATVWYLDADGDGLGATSPLNKVQCSQPPNDANGTYVLNNSDLCPNVNGPQANNGCTNQNPLSVNDTDRNYVWSIGYDIDQTIKQNGITYYDELGKVDQSQNLDTKTGQIWANQTLYDTEGRPALTSFGAPTGINGTFEYQDTFVSKTNGNPYTKSDFESNENNPAIVGKQSSTLGWFYSENNTREPYQDATDYPFSRSIYSKFMPNVPLKTIGGNKINGEWPQAYSFTMRASKELSQNGAFGDSSYDNYRIYKTVTRDVHGVENVVFEDRDGLVLASARSGGTAYRSMSIPIGEQGYIDIHVPAGSNMGFTVSAGGNTITTYNLISESTVSPSIGLANGFYRVAVSNPDSYVAGSATVTYRENYYDYALNEYDDADRLVASYQPKGSTLATKPKTTYQYDALGQLTYTDSPDEGKAWFKYRKDGQIRYSQNSKQKDPNEDGSYGDAEFSYTQYDTFGRPIESGVLVGTGFQNADPDNPNLASGTKKEVQNTIYDSTTNAFDLGSRQSSYPSMDFTAGNVVYTANDQSKTWYSYDIYGRVKWLVQEIVGLNNTRALRTKTVDYEYHPVSGLVTQVIYQKDASDQFIHRYTYNIADELTTVETSTNGSTYLTQATYTYYESGGLKRMELANGAQGLDYVYSLGGQLKGINHPALNATSDPGGDTNDLFGMQLDYHRSDYQRNVPNIGAAVYGQDRLNGNLKGIRWNNKILNQSNPSAYAFQYNRDNWLTNADFGTFLGNGNSSAPTTYPDNGTYTSASGTIVREATQSITLGENFHAQPGSNFTARIVSANGFEDVGNGEYDVTGIEYDPNGNIEKLKRNKDGSNKAMDDLTYRYKTTPQDGPNQLLRVDDATYNGSGDAPNADDITDQDGNNYDYNAIGQMTANVSEGLTYMYNASGLVTEVSKNGQPLVRFNYNDRNHRVKKERYNAQGDLVQTTHYVRDVAGSVMAVYIDQSIKEHPIYGSSRIGIRQVGSSTDKYVYEMTDHLGNVRMVFEKSGNTAVEEGFTDYYPFGMPMPNRNGLDPDNYRYAFQGQEKDAQTGMEAFELRLWDGRLGRWLTTDPARQYVSPYLGMGNNPLSMIDPDGAMAINGCCDGWKKLWDWATGIGKAKDQIAQSQGSNITDEEIEFKNGERLSEGLAGAEEDLRNLPYNLTPDAIGLHAGGSGGAFIGGDTNVQAVLILKGEDAGYFNLFINSGGYAADGVDTSFSAGIDFGYYTGNSVHTSVDLPGTYAGGEVGISPGVGFSVSNILSLDSELTPTWNWSSANFSLGVKASPASGANLKAVYGATTPFFKNERK